MREVRSVRERDTERERERGEREWVRRKWRHLSSAEFGDEFCTFPCQNVHLSIGEEFCTFPCEKVAPLSRTLLLNGAGVHTSIAPKYVALFETVGILRRICQMAWQGIEAPKQTIEFPAAPSFFSSKKWMKLIPKTIGNKHHLRKSADWKAQIRTAFVPLTGLICAFRSADFLRWCLSPERNLTHNLFFYFQ